MMGDIVPLRLFDAGPPEKPDVTVGQALFGAIVEANAEAGMVIPRSVIATAAKHGTDALADGVDPEIVLVGCLVALRQGKGRVANLIIADIVYAKAGQAMTPQDYRHFLAIESRQHNPDVQRIREAMQKQIEQKQIGGKS